MLNKETQARTNTHWLAQEFFSGASINMRTSKVRQTEKGSTHDTVFNYVNRENYGGGGNTKPCTECILHDSQHDKVNRNNKKLNNGTLLREAAATFRCCEVQSNDVLTWRRPLNCTAGEASWGSQKLLHLSYVMKVLS